VVRAFDGHEEAMLHSLELKGVYVQRVKLTRRDLPAAYENLSMLMHTHAISYPRYPELLAELDVFKSDFTVSRVPDYSLQIAQQSGIHALCLVTYDVDTQALPPFSFLYNSIHYSRSRFGAGGVVWSGANVITRTTGPTEVGVAQRD
jgi:hypothetical protein